MKNISRRIWGTGKTVKEWAEEKGFNYAYVAAVIGGRKIRGVGVGGDILKELVKDKILTADEAKQRGLAA